MFLHQKLRRTAKQAAQLHRNQRDTVTLHVDHPEPALEGFGEQTAAGVEVRRFNAAQLFSTAERDGVADNVHKRLLLARPGVQLVGRRAAGFLVDGDFLFLGRQTQDFLAMDLEVRRRFDAEFDRFLVDPQDAHDHPVANDDTFVKFTGENKQVEKR